MALLRFDKGWSGRSHLTVYKAAQSFFADRICTPAAEAFLVLQGKSKGRQKANLETRWKLLTYLLFGAAKVISAQQAREYVEKGAEEPPTHWIERDKNEFKRSKMRPSSQI